ncbi:MAG: galactose mutarotase [Muricauda sp.]|nr:galactose mutarotase [Allomuricauda sp.]
MMSQKTLDGTITLLQKANFEKEVNGKKVGLYTLSNSNGLVAEITNYGGKVVSLWVPDRLGNFEDIVLGYPKLDGFLTAKEKYFGALIGRYGNRIAEGKFTLDGKQYTLATNNDANHLHGGNHGFDDVVWEAKQLDDHTLQLSYTSVDMEEGYPGNLDVVVTYELTEDNELKISYKAATDKPTVLNLTHHSFFNLKGTGAGSINDHLLQINAAYYTPVDSMLIPTGELATVKGTPFDFQEPTTIGARVNQDYVQLKYGNGYDHNFVLNQSLEGLNFAARVIEPVSGRIMDVFTNEPGLQFYGGNFLDGTIVGKQEKQYDFRTAFCLETQHFPDSPNNPHFPSTRLDPGEDYQSICIYKFTTLRK